jgi:serine/threonine protein kinase
MYSHVAETNQGACLGMSQNQAPTIISSRYEVLSLLGEGGMGRVYKAKDKILEREVAVKVLLGQYAVQNVQRFQREAKTMSSLKHSNLIDVYDFGITNDGSAYLVMEYVVGALLSDVLKKRKHLSIEETIALSIEIADGMRHAHNKGFVHRDLKPSNIMIRNELRVSDIKIFDFGISKALSEKGDLTQTGAMLGTPLYMSPEQAQSKPVDGRSDQYALGCIIYACLSGRPPFRGDTALDTIGMHIKEPPKPLVGNCKDLDVSPELDAVVLKLLSKDPLDRYASMDEVMEALAAASAKPIEQHAAITQMRKERSTKAFWKLSAVPLAAVLLAAGLFCLAVLNSQPPIPAKPNPDDNFWKPDQEQVPNLSNYETEDQGTLTKAELQEQAKGFFSDATMQKAEYDSFQVAQWLPTSAFAKLPRERVRKLSIHGRTRLQSGASAAIAKFPNLFELWISGDRIRDDLGDLSGMKNLESLALCVNSVSDNDFERIKDLPKLKFLSLERTRVTDESLKAMVKHFPNIEIIDLGYTMLNGASLGELANLPRLKRLELNNMLNAFDDNALAHLRGVKELKVIDLAYNKSISEKGLRALIANNPKLETVRITLSPKLAKPDVIERLTDEFAKKHRHVVLVNERRDYNSGWERYADKAKSLDFTTMTDLMDGDGK